MSANHTSNNILLALAPAQSKTREAIQTLPARPVKRRISQHQNKIKLLTTKLPAAKKITAHKKSRSSNNSGRPLSQKRVTVKIRTQTNHPETLRTDSQLISERIQKQLNIKLGFKRQYPAIAIRNAWQGKVDLGIRIQANGRLTHVHVIKSSGYNILDNAAITSVHKVASLPEAVYWLNGNYIDVILPVIYKLTES